MKTVVLGPNNERYEEYFIKWNDELAQISQALMDGLNDNADEGKLRKLVQRAEKHYESYYVAKDGAAKQDVLEVMHPSWKTPLENAFLWIGGWRPTMVFQLAYAQAGQQIEAELAEFLSGLETPTMASLSSKQLSQISNLQILTQKAEDVLSHRQAILQQGIADHPLLTLAQLELGGEPSDSGNSLEDAMDEKVKALEELLSDADDLRFDTLKEFLKILTPTQGAQYLVAASQLNLAVRRVGKAKEGEDTASRNEQSS